MLTNTTQLDFNVNLSNNLLKKLGVGNWHNRESNRELWIDSIQELGSVFSWLSVNSQKQNG